MILKILDRQYDQIISTRLSQNEYVTEVGALLQDPYLPVFGAVAGDVNRFIQAVAEEVRRLNNGLEGRSLIEIIETRLVPGKEEITGQIRLTPGILLDFDGAGKRTAGQEVCHVVLNAGHVFGSGQHPSTRLAAIALEEYFRTAAGPPGKALDIGCGSGILSIICAKLGALEVLGVDIDSAALHIARVNVERNNLSQTVKISEIPLAQIGEEFDLLVANMTPSVLAVQAHHFARLLRQDGQLIIAGFQDRQAQNLEELFGSQGFELVKSYEEDEGWQAMRFR